MASEPQILRRLEEKQLESAPPIEYHEVSINDARAVFSEMEARGNDMENVKRNFSSLSKQGRNEFVINALEKFRPKDIHGFDLERPEIADIQEGREIAKQEGLGFGAAFVSGLKEEVALGLQEEIDVGVQSLPQSGVKVDRQAEVAKQERVKASLAADHPFAFGSGSTVGFILGLPGQVTKLGLRALAKTPAGKRITKKLSKTIFEQMFKASLETGTHVFAKRGVQTGDLKQAALDSITPAIVGGVGAGVIGGAISNVAPVVSKSIGKGGLLSAKASVEVARWARKKITPNETGWFRSLRAQIADPATYNKLKAPIGKDFTGEVMIKEFDRIFSETGKKLSIILNEFVDSVSKKDAKLVDMVGKTMLREGEKQGEMNLFAATRLFKTFLNERKSINTKYGVALKKIGKQADDSGTLVDLTGTIGVIDQELIARGAMNEAGEIIPGSILETRNPGLYQRLVGLRRGLTEKIVLNKEVLVPPAKLKTGLLSTTRKVSESGDITDIAKARLGDQVTTTSTKVSKKGTATEIHRNTPPLPKTKIVKKSVEDNLPVFKLSEGLEIIRGVSREINFASPSPTDVVMLKVRKQLARELESSFGGIKELNEAYTFSRNRIDSLFDILPTKGRRTVNKYSMEAYVERLAYKAVGSGRKEIRTLLKNTEPFPNLHKAVKIAINVSQRGKHLKGFSSLPGDAPEKVAFAIQLSHLTKKAYDEKLSASALRDLVFETVGGKKLTPVAMTRFLAEYAQRLESPEKVGLLEILDTVIQSIPGVGGAIAQTTRARDAQILSQSMAGLFRGGAQKVMGGSTARGVGEFSSGIESIASSVIDSLYRASEKEWVAALKYAPPYVLHEVTSGGVRRAMVLWANSNYNSMVEALGFVEKQSLIENNSHIIKETYGD